MPVPAEVPTLVALIPSSAPLFTLIRVRLTPPPTFVSRIPGPVEFWIAPPVQEAAKVQVPPLPTTDNPPAPPVLLRRMPFVAPFAEIFWNLSPLELMVVLVTLSAVPVVVVRTLVFVPTGLTLRVPWREPL